MKLEKRLEINGHAGAIYSCVFQSPHYIFTGAGDKFVAKWNLKTGTQEAFSIKSEQAVYAVKLIQKQQILVIGTSSGSLHLIDLQLKKELKHFIQHQSATFCISENPDLHHFYTSDADGNLAVWNTNNFELLLFLPLLVGKIRSMQVVQNGTKLMLSSQDGSIRIFETKHFNELISFNAHDLGTNDTAINPLQPNKLFSVGKDGLLKCWNLDSLKLIISIPAHNFGIYQIEFLNHGKQFVTISRDKSIKLWDTENLSVIQKIERKQGGHSHAVNSIAKINEFEIVTVGDDKRMNYWDLKF
jgi:WD40 repeat protein